MVYPNNQTPVKFQVRTYAKINKKTTTVLILIQVTLRVHKLSLGEGFYKDKPNLSLDRFRCLGASTKLPLKVKTHTPRTANDKINPAIKNCMTY